MTIIRHSDIIAAIEEAIPPGLQESYDNTGLQLGDPSAPCSGVLLCVDLTEATIAEAARRGCSMVITHHPLIFRPVKQIAGRNRVEKCIAGAIRAGLTVYSCHTSADAVAQIGVSWEMGRRLGLSDMEPLTASPGMGIAGNLPEALGRDKFVSLVKHTFHTPVARCSALTPAAVADRIVRVALCGGSGSDLLPQAIAAGAQAFISSDTRLNLFIDYADQILLVDIGHWEAENCTKEIFREIILGKFPNFAVFKSTDETNPIQYL